MHAGTARPTRACAAWQMCVARWATLRAPRLVRRPLHSCPLHNVTHVCMLHAVHKPVSLGLVPALLIRPSW